MKNSEEIVEILEADDLTGSFRAAAELVGCDQHTVARYVRLRELGRSPEFEPATYRLEGDVSLSHELAPASTPWSRRMPIDGRSSSPHRSAQGS